MRSVNGGWPVSGGWRAGGVVALLAALAGCGMAVSSGSGNGGGDGAQLGPATEKFIHSALALHPADATGQGYHEHNGVALDEQLTDWTPAGRERARSFYRQELTELGEITKGGVNAEEQADIDLMRLESEARLLDLEDIQPFRHNPTTYVEDLGSALYAPTILNYAPEAKRYAQVTARVEKIPAYLTAAKGNLTDAPEIWNQVAREENEGNLDLVDKTIRAKIPAELKERYDAAAERALAALKNFDTFLAKDLAKRTSDWRLGSRFYNEKFKLSLATGDTPGQALEDAEAKLESLRGEMRGEAAALYPKFFPGKTVPAETNAVISEVLGRIAQQHATPATYFDDAKRDLTDTKAFVEEHHLLTLPTGNNLEVIPTPVFMRGVYGVGGFSSAPALEPQLGSFYWITPFTGDMSPARVESKLREYNFYGLKILTIHEAMPGHFVQFEYATQIQPEWRRALRSIYSNNPYVEGWAVYATEMMIEEGYLKTPEMKLTLGKQMLRVVSNTILDVRMHTMGMTDQQAMDLMINQTFQEKEEAEKKLQRAKLSSCQLPTYFVGWRGWDRLRDRYKKEHGASYKTADFNERGLREGSIALPSLARVLQQ